METETLNAILGIMGTLATGAVTILITNIKVRRDQHRAEQKQRERDQQIIADAQASAKKLIEASFEGLNKELEFNKEQFLLTQKDRDEQREKNEQSAARISELIVSKGEIKDALDETRGELQQTRAELGKAQNGLTEAQEEIRRLINRLEKYVENDARRDTEMEKLNAEVVQLRPLRQEVSDLRAQIKSLNDQLNKADVEQHSLARQRERDQEEFGRQRDEWRSRLSELAERVRLLETENKVLRTENGQLKEEVELLKTQVKPTSLPAGTFMFEDVKNAAGDTVIKAEVIPASGEHSTDDLADKEKP